MAEPPSHSSPSFTDDKSEACLSFILSHYHTHTKSDPTHNPHPQRPLIIGLNGVQGSGKTSLVRILASTLRSQHHLTVLVASIDDFYLTHTAQVALASSHPDNALVQTRGEPGTHDIALLQRTFDALVNGKETRIPQYDKSAFAGQGDRLRESEWEVVNGPNQSPLQIVLFEGWCVGFRAISEDEVEQRWIGESRTLRKHKLEHLQWVNTQLREYDMVTNLFDAFIHIDAEDTENVYKWRLEQEHGLWASKGTGMTDEQVIRFVDAYYPAYELFTDRLRSGIFADNVKGRQLRIVIDQHRKTKETIVI